MPIVLSWLIYIVYVVAYAMVFAGWIWYQPETVVPMPLNRGYYLFLGLMAMPFFLPLLPALARRFLFVKRLIFMLVPVVGMLAMLYAVCAVHFYYTQLHPFDPFLQNPPPRFDNVPKEKSKGTVRILFLGGSTTQWGKLRDEDQYPTVVKELLDNRFPDTTIEVLNAGKEYYTTKHSLINYVTYCRRWKPDVVVIMHAINDVCRSFTPGRFGMGKYDELWSHYYGPAIGAARPQPYEMVALNGFFARTAKRWYYALRVKEVDYPLSRYLSLPTYETHLSTLVELVKRDTPHVVLVLQPSIFKDEMPIDELRRLKFGKYFSMVRQDYFHQEYPTAQSLGRAMKEIHVITRRIADAQSTWLADAESLVEKNLKYFVDDVHYTPEGAKQVAASVADTIVQSGLIEVVSQSR